MVVTREAGKNGKLVKALSQHNISCVELPLIEHAAGPDRFVGGLVRAAGWLGLNSHPGNS